MKPARGRPSGSLERAVIACLATASGPMTAAEVQAELGDGLAYTTVMTTLSRLHAKQALERSPRGRAYAYHLVGDPSEAQASVTAHQMRKLLDAGTDRASVLSHFVEKLDDESERVLRALLRDDGPPATPRRSRRRSAP
jgi:predicted transcriptional regulator